MQVAGYEDLERLHDGGQAVVYRARRAADGQPVVLKMLRGPYPTPAQRIRFRNEYELIERLRGRGVVQVESWEELDGLPTIALRDTGATSLEKLWPDGPPPLHVALGVAIRIVECVQRIHAERVLHLDLNPANIILVPGTGDVRLIDFGLATDLPRLSASLRAEQVLGGTLRFAAPEQTGRMNRSVDYRSDHYALGATLYWLLSGRPPFEGNDALELVHAHIARTPAPIEGVPAPLSDVVLKLLEKGAEDRYQSTHGLLVDLRICQEQLLDDHPRPPFVIAASDRPARFAIPEKLYGRDRERATLLEAFERAADGGREVVWVQGRSGMGKTALVQEVQRPIAGRKGIYIAGKFDQFKRGIPYASLGNALRPFVRQLLSGQQGDVALWRERLKAAVAPNGRLLTELIPELELVLGPQAEVADLPPLEAEQRLHRTFRLFLRSLASSDHPLVLFLDDLQWADLASLSLLRVLATDAGSSHVLLIGAYRDLEVGPEHAVNGLMADLEAAEVAVSTIRVGSLGEDDVVRLLTDTLRQQPHEVRPLAAVSCDKTGGNPFFMHRFLQSLVEAEQLRFDGARGEWTFDLAPIRALDVTDNVVAFMGERMGRLPADALRALDAGAVAGVRFDLELLAAAIERTPEEVARALHPALQAGLIEEIVGREASRDATFRFLHDRIQQAAYERTDDATRRALHRRFGELLLRSTPDIPSSDALFDVVNHLNAGQRTGDEVARLNRIAGERALASSAYAPAADYLRRARDLLGDEAWGEHPATMRDLTLTAARAAYLRSDHAEMDALVSEALAHAHDDLDRIRALRIRIDALIMRNRTADAVALGLDALRLVGIDLPSSPTEDDIGAGLGATFARLEGVDLEQLAGRPAPTDPQTLLAMELLCTLAPPAYFTSQALVPMLGIEIVRLSLQRGPTVESSYGFSLLGLVMCDVGQIEAGYQFGTLAWALAGRFDDQRMRVRSGHVFNGFSRHWVQPVPSLLGDYHALYELAVDIGDFEYAGYIGMMHTIFRLYTAEDLRRVAPSAQRYADMMQESQQLNSLAVHGMVHQALLNLLGESDDPVVLTGRVFDEPSMLAIFRKLQDPTCLFVVHCLKAVVAAVHGAWRQALGFAAEAHVYDHGATATIHKVTLAQWTGLAAASLARQTTGDEQQQWLAQVDEALDLLDRVAAHNPVSHGHRPGLVRGARAAVGGDREGALALLEATAAMAREHRCPQEVAAALRTAGEVCQEAGWTTAARGYLIEARNAFAQWGSNSAVNALDRAYPQLLGNLAARGVDRSATSISDGTSTSSGRVDLDTAAVIRASQAVAKEIELPRLVETVVRLSMEVSGATGAVLVRDNGGSWVATAVGVARAQIVVDATPVPLDGADVAPRGVIDLVARTREALVLTDAQSEPLTAADPYVTRHGVRSLLVAPIEQQGRVDGVLYLEHRGTSGVFTRERVALVRVLLAQAAISVQNAELVDTLEEKVRARTAQLAAASEAKTRFLRSMSHELRTPLNGILGYAQLLADDDRLDPKQKEGVATIRRSGTHLLSLINDILDMNKIEAGRLDLVIAPMRLEGFVQAVARFAEPEASRKGVALTVASAPELPAWIEADAKRLRQVVLNLVGNAVKFTDRGEVRVLADCTTAGLRVAVEDTGPGIEPERLDSIFDPFEQAGGAEQRSKGTGLGLAISRQLARQMGGDLYVHSTLGEGSTFVLDVPLTPCDEPADAQPTPDPAPEAPPPRRPELSWPSPEVLVQLRELAGQGAYSELRRRVDELASGDETLQPFASELSRLARDFDEDGVDALLSRAVSPR